MRIDSRMAFTRYHLLWVPPPAYALHEPLPGSRVDFRNFTDERTCASWRSWSGAYSSWTTCWGLGIVLWLSARHCWSYVLRSHCLLLPIGGARFTVRSVCKWGDSFVGSASEHLKELLRKCSSLAALDSWGAASGQLETSIFGCHLQRRRCLLSVTFQIFLQLHLLACRNRRSESHWSHSAGHQQGLKRHHC